MSLPDPAALELGGGSARWAGRPAVTPGASGARGGGFGLVGMRERVHLLGGRFAAGPAAGGGWQVTADVPLHQPEPHRPDR